MTARNERGNSPAPDKSDRPLFDENFAEGIRLQESKRASLNGEEARELFVFYDSVKSPFAIIEAAFDRADKLSEELGVSLATPRPSKAVFEEDRKAFIEAANKAKEDSKIFTSGPNGPIEYDIREAARELGLRIVKANHKAGADQSRDGGEEELSLGTPLGSLSMPDPTDGQTLIGDPSGDRWLEIGGIAMLIGMSGIGKSALLLQMLVLWSLGRPAFGIKPARPLKSVLVQVENSNGELAMTREGIFDGLALSSKEMKIARSNIITHRECDDYGIDLVESKLAPLCDNWNPDIVALDPLTQLYGDNMNDNQQAAAWMTRGLQALALAHECGIIVNHHTNKPQKDDGKASVVEGRYAGAGAAAFTNVPRANLVIRDIGESDVFKLSAEKRGNCIGWTDESGASCRFKYIAHSNERRDDGSRVIFWREPSWEEVSEIEEGQKKQTAQKGRYSLKSKKKGYAEKALEVLRREGPLAHGKWREAIMDSGIPKTGANDGIKILKEANRVDNPHGLYQVIETDEV